MQQQHSGNNINPEQGTLILKTKCANNQTRLNINGCQIDNIDCTIVRITDLLGVPIGLISYFLTAYRLITFLNKHFLSHRLFINRQVRSFVVIVAPK